MAADRLNRPGASIADVARKLGYGSEGAFSTAFKRVMGHSPRQYGRAEKKGNAVVKPQGAAKGEDGSPLPLDLRLEDGQMKGATVFGGVLDGFVDLVEPEGFHLEVFQTQQTGTH